MAQSETSGKTGTDWSNWRALLPQLDNLGLVLLPIGAKPPERKAPVDPMTGYGLSNWQNHLGFSVAALAAANSKHVIGACINTGPSGLAVLDLDGPAAVALLEARGLDPRDPALFRITRTTDPDRFKIPFRLTPEQRLRFPENKTLLRVGEPDAEGRRQAIEIYAKNGAQVIVLGQHCKSGGWYSWAGDPSAIGPPSEAWLEAMLAICSEVEALRGKGDRSKPPKVGRTGGTGSRWQASGHRNPCPICGRDHSAACTWTEDQGRRLATCFHGGSFSPDTSLQAGDVITGKDGNEWALVRTYHADCLGEKSLFVNHQEQPDDDPLDLDAAFPDLPTDDTQEPRVGPSPPEDDPPQAKAAPGPPKARKPRPGGARLTPFQVLTSLPDRLGGEPRLDIRSGTITTPEGTFTGNDCSNLYLRLSSKRETWPKDATADAVGYLARGNAFDPVLDYLQALHGDPLPLEQWNRLDLHLLGIDDPIAAEFLPRFLISAVARAFEPGCGVRQSPVLVGPQWRGKTALGRILFGQAHWIEGVGSLDKDALLRCHTAWGVELSELNGVSRRSDQEALKAFLTERADSFRRPYERSPEQHLRGFVFWGTANSPPFRDSTGSTRFVSIPIPDRMLPLDWAIANRDPLWHQARLQYQAGLPWDYCTEEMRAAVAERNEDYAEIDPWAETIKTWLEARQKTIESLRERKESFETLLPVKYGDIYEILFVPKERQTSATSGRIRAVMERLGWSYEQRRWGGALARVRGFWPVG